MEGRLATPALGHGVAGLVTLLEKYVVLSDKYTAGLVTLPEKYVVLSDTGPAPTRGGLVPQTTCLAPPNKQAFSFEDSDFCA